jgi:hypothetical protein
MTPCSLVEREQTIWHISEDCKTNTPSIRTSNPTRNENNTLAINLNRRPHEEITCRYNNKTETDFREIYHGDNSG